MSSKRYSSVNKKDNKGKYVADITWSFKDKFMNFVYSHFRSFRFMGHKYGYFYHSYNTTWRNERIVEVPIILSILRKYKNKRILEVGNVISHYYHFSHDIIDKYENRPGVINMDVVDFKVGSKNKYNLIFSISTLEHVGWDETPHEKRKILKAVNTLRKCLIPGGKLVVTFPIGYNSDLDELIKSKELKFSEVKYLKRISKTLNRWREASWEEIKDLEYGVPYQNANGLIVGTFSSI